MLKRVGEKIKFAKRTGIIVAHTTFALRAGDVENYYIVALDTASCGYLEPIGTAPDCFISIMLVHEGNEE
jgi:hypothetical protein